MSPRYLLLIVLLTFSSCDDSSTPGEFVNEPLILTGNDTYNEDQCGPDIYPCPPYGTRQYQTLRNIPFLPANSAAEAMAEDNGVSWLSYFYLLREEGYQLLHITLTAEWCDVCEAQMNTLGAMVNQYGFLADDPRVAFLGVVTENDSLEDASLEVASNYSASHNLDDLVPITNDENLAFRQLMTSASYPFNIFVDLENMEIIGYDSGLESEQIFSQKLDEMLAFVQ
ncbi:hypothetical protein KKF84_19335 [Myxococcota bacterium]|nr:hypothetical protein [Myxococcota bacterium]